MRGVGAAALGGSGREMYGSIFSFSLLCGFPLFVKEKRASELVHAEMPSSISPSTPTSTPLTKPCNGHAELHRCTHINLCNNTG